ncbi:MAG: hypothetical protein LBH86_09230 [Oscillospiraceae bacterium]|jgi:maltose-binding protein MalE|nr:hypothetical protein [Oscillospiraceae bacterium]
MKKHVCFLAFIFVAVLFSCLLSACTVADTDPSALETYDFGRDKVPSVTSVVGRRTVTDVESEGKNEFPSRQYTYQSDSVSDDLSQYIQRLQEQAWTATGVGYNLEESPGSAQFFKESADEGQILTVFITYEDNEYAIKVTKMEAILQ